MIFFSTSGTWERRAQQADRLHQARVFLARSMLARLPHDALEAIAEAAIGILDDHTDPDEDHCLAGDDSCDAFIGGSMGGVHWGSAQDAEVDHAPPAEYGLDQREILLPCGDRLSVG